MYAALWNFLPGPPWARALLCVGLGIIVLAACFEYVFPWLSDYMPFNDTTVGE